MVTSAAVVHTVKESTSQLRVTVGTDGVCSSVEPVTGFSYGAKVGSVVGSAVGVSVGIPVG